VNAGLDTHEYARGISLADERTDQILLTNFAVHGALRATDFGRVAACAPPGLSRVVGGVEQRFSGAAHMLRHSMRWPPSSNRVACADA